MSSSTAPPFCSLTRTARIVPLTRPQTVMCCAMTLPSTCAPSPDQELRGAQLTFDSAEDLRWTIAFDVANDRHAGADARAHSRFRRRLRCGLFNDRALRLHHLSR